MASRQRIITLNTVIDAKQSPFWASRRDGQIACTLAPLNMEAQFASSCKSRVEQDLTSFRRVHRNDPKFKDDRPHPLPLVPRVHRAREAIHTSGLADVLT